MKQKSNFSFLLSYAKNEKYKLYFSAFLSICSSILMVVPYILIYNIILELLKADLDYNRIKKLAIYTAILIVVKLVLFILSGVFSHVAAFSILYNIRIQAVKHLGNINLGYFREKNIGEIKKAINEDVEKLENFLAHQIPDLAGAITTPIVILVFLFFLEWRIAIFLIIPIILAILTQFAMFKGYGKRLDNYNSLLQRLTSTITQYIKGMNVFKAFNLTAHSFKKYIDVNNEYTENWHEMTDDYRSPYGIFLAVVDSALIFVIPSGGYLYLTDKINISTFLIFLLLSYTFLSSFKILMQFAGTFSFVLAGANNVRSIIEFPIQNDGKNLKNINFKEDILFSNVTFSYDKNDVLKNINLILKINTITALVGPSGSGKTTIAYLLGRFWDVQKGSIKIGDIDIKDIDVNYLLSNISYVFQDIFILTDTIFENIKMGLDKTKEEVYQAAKDAEIHEFIMSLPNGYDTIIGDGYIKLSGGEKQRISIARCLLKNSPIVVLDEITAYSDIENEAKIQSAIRNLLKDKTAIIIAHRLYTIKDVDNIIVLNEGEIVESGKHQDLITKENGLYKHLWEVK